jgi:sec-independent protein translocase protein TatB
MFDLSFGKLAIIFALCLIVLGPEKLPKLAQQLGRWTGQARAMARHFRSQLEQELAAEDLLKQKREIEQRLSEPFKSTSDAVQSAATEVSSVGNTVTNTVHSAVSGFPDPSDDTYSHEHHGPQAVQQVIELASQRTAEPVVEPASQQTSQHSPQQAVVENSPADSANTDHTHTPAATPDKTSPTTPA